MGAGTPYFKGAKLRGAVVAAPFPCAQLVAVTWSPAETSQATLCPLRCQDSHSLCSMCLRDSRVSSQLI